MTDELREAAERVRGNWGGYQGVRDEYNIQLNDLNKLAQAYLAEHPANDSEPATPEWWKSVKPECDFRFAIQMEFDAMSDDFFLYSGPALISTNPTRRQVRALAEACGVKLREEGVK